MYHIFAEKNKKKDIVVQQKNIWFQRVAPSLFLLFTILGILPNMYIFHNLQKTYMKICPTLKFALGDPIPTKSRVLSLVRWSNVPDLMHDCNIQLEILRQLWVLGYDSKFCIGKWITPCSPI